MLCLCLHYHLKCWLFMHSFSCMLCNYKKVNTNKYTKIFQPSFIHKIFAHNILPIVKAQLAPKSIQRLRILWLTCSLTLTWYLILQIDNKKNKRSSPSYNTTWNGTERGEEGEKKQKWRATHFHRNIIKQTLPIVHLCY